LLELKQKKGIGSASQMSAPQSKYEKKYLIMTFEGEFEKVHYPLPLNYLEEPDMQSMYKTF